MKKPIENFIIVGDGLTKEPSFKEVSLLDNKFSTFSELISNNSPVWYEILLDIIFYTANNLPSSFSTDNYIKFRKEFNLQHYVFNYIYDKVRIIDDEDSPAKRREGCKANAAKMGKVCKDLENLIKQNIVNNSLVILFIGFDDINSPSLNIVALVEQYVDKINLLINARYTNFAIIDIPNIFDEEFAAKIDLFNTILNTQIEILRQFNPAITIDILSSSRSLNNLSKFLEQDAETKIFNLSSEAHSALANSFYTRIFASKYEFMLPRQILLELFRTRYFDIISQNKASYFSWFYAKPWDKYEFASLSEIFLHCDPSKNNRTFQVLKKLEWVNQSGECISTNPIIISNAESLKSRITSIC